MTRRRIASATGSNAVGRLLIRISTRSFPAFDNFFGEIGGPILGGVGFVLAASSFASAGEVGGQHFPDGRLMTAAAFNAVYGPNGSAYEGGHCDIPADRLESRQKQQTKSTPKPPVPPTTPTPTGTPGGGKPSLPRARVLVQLR